MTMKRPLYLMREKTRHGLVVWYFRRSDGPRIRIRGDYGSAEFIAEYQAALAGSPPPQKERVSDSADSIAWLVTRYRESSKWTSLAAETRRTREYVLRQFESIDLPYASITAVDLMASMEKRADKPTAANHFLKTARGLFGWAKKAQLIATDPSLDVERLATAPSQGHHTWTDEEIAAFERRWPIGTRERLALAILLYTGLRRGDAARLGKQHLRRGIVSIGIDADRLAARAQEAVRAVVAATASRRRRDLPPVTPEQLHEIGTACFGRSYQHQLADALEINPRTMRRFMSGEMEVPDGVREELTAIVYHRIALLNGALAILKSS